MRLDLKVWNILAAIIFGLLFVLLIIGAFSFETVEKLRSVPGYIPFISLYFVFFLLFLGAYAFKDKEGYVSLKVIIRGGIFMIFLALFYDTFFGGGIVEHLLSFIF